MNTSGSKRTRCDGSSDSPCSTNMDSEEKMTQLITNGETRVPTYSTEYLLSVSPRRVIEPKVSFMCFVCFQSCIVGPCVIHQQMSSNKSHICIACFECSKKWHSFQKGIAAAQGIQHGHPCCPVCQQHLGSERDLSSYYFPTLNEWKAAKRTEGNYNDDVYVTNLFTGHESNREVIPRLSNIVRLSCGVEGDTSGNCTDDTCVPLCGICEEIPGVYDCLECEFALCIQCHAGVHSKGRYKQHRCVSIGKGVKLAPRKCFSHPNYNLDLFCNSCQVPVCVICSFRSTQHESHDLVTIEDAETAISLEFYNIAGTIVALEERTSQMAASFDKIASSIRERNIAVKMEIADQFSAFRNALNARENELLEKLNAVTKEQADSNDESSLIFKLLSDWLGNLNCCIDTIIADAHPVHIAQIGKPIHERMRFFLNVVSRMVDGPQLLKNLGEGKSADEAAVEGSLKSFIPDLKAFGFHADDIKKLVSDVQQAGHISIPPVRPLFALHNTTCEVNHSTLSPQIQSLHSERISIPQTKVKKEDDSVCVQEIDNRMSTDAGDGRKDYKELSVVLDVPHHCDPSEVDASNVKDKSHASRPKPTLGIIQQLFKGHKSETASRKKKYRYGKRHGKS